MPASIELAIGFGSNLSFRPHAHARRLRPAQIIHRAYKMLGQHPQIHCQALSKLYKNPALLPADFDRQHECSNDFYNAVALYRSSLPAAQLLGVLQGVELAFGRQHGKRWRARSLDLDLLLYANQVIQSPELQVPHPQLELRDFVLLPLAELLGGDYQIQLLHTKKPLQAIIAQLELQSKAQTCR